MANTINWFEIPVTDFQRAKKFYNAILGIEIEEGEMGNFKMGMFPGGDGALIHGEGYKPSDTGVVIYLNGGDDLSNILSKVKDAGGNIIIEKTLITEEIGYYAFFHDTEGNRIGLHSQK